MPGAKKAPVLSTTPQPPPPAPTARELGLAWTLLYTEQKAKNPSLTPASFNAWVAATLKSAAAAGKPKK